MRKRPYSPDARPRGAPFETVPLGACSLTLWRVWSRFSEWCRTQSLERSRKESSCPCSNCVVVFYRAATPKNFKPYVLVVRIVCNSESFGHAAAVLCRRQELVERTHFLSSTEPREDGKDEGHFAQQLFVKKAVRLPCFLRSLN